MISEFQGDSAVSSVSPHNVANRLIVALDVPTIQEASELVDRLSGVVAIFKVGLALWSADGFDNLIQKIIKSGKKVFLDAKMYDIDNTVELAVKTAARRGFSFVTVHHNETVVRAAVKGRGDYNMKIFTVTVLTSLDDENLKDMGYTNTVKEIIGWRAARALDFGCDGIIAAPSDDLAGIKAMTRERGKDLIIATPGIRPAGSSIDDHQRSGTPSTAIKAGADYLIVGRPIYTSINPSQAALNIIQEMTGAMPSGD